jgi:hypothetical protein
MNATQLRQAGYTVIFENGFVWLYRHASETAIQGLINQGLWMDEPFNVNDKAKWSEPFYLPETDRALADKFHAIAEACYCSSLTGSTCDFCGCVRAVPSAENEERQ